jgi:hypothetical protein
MKVDWKLESAALISPLAAVGSVRPRRHDNTFAKRAKRIKNAWLYQFDTIDCQVTQSSANARDFGD